MRGLILGREENPSTQANNENPTYNQLSLAIENKRCKMHYKVIKLM